MKRRLLFLLIGMCALSAAAQGNSFEVRGFKLLQNDITAYVDPVRDLNNEACALIKLVGDENFVISTPLGVVKRVAEVGEIWLYVPKGTSRITIKHPLWGVLRDYTFPEVLESRLTYELTLVPPMTINFQLERWLKVSGKLRPLPVFDSKHPRKLQQPYKLRIRRPKLPLTSTAMLSVGAHESAPSIGIFFAMMRRHGFYVRALSNFKTIDTQYDANKEGLLADSETKPFYTGATRRTRHSFTAGAVHRLSSAFYIYEGLGYGEQTRAWQTTENEWVRITDYSQRGLAAELGLMWKHKRLTASLGVLTIQAKYWEPVAAVGFAF